MQLKGTTLAKGKSVAQPPAFYLFVWCLFFIAFPFYVFGSGLPQPADWVMVSLVGYVILAGWNRKSVRASEVKSALRFFIILVVTLNTFWAFFIDQSIENIPSYFHSAFYVYNFFVFSTAITLAFVYKEKFLRYTAYAVGISMILQAVLSFVTGTVQSRNSLFFNNPNQLGYYALLSGSLFVYMVRSVKVHSLFQVAAYFAFLYLTLLSASKAALSGAGILVTLAVFNQGLLNVRQFFTLLIAALIGFYFITSGGLGTSLFTYASDRFETIGSSGDDSAEGRGYDRIFNNPEYMLIGAGEGGYYRFDTVLKSSEIHSTFGTILFCYGVFGMFLFLRFLTIIFRRSTLFELLYFLPIAIYSVTHQGLRSTFFWVFLSCIYVLNFAKRRPSAKSHKTRIRKAPPIPVSQPQLSP